MRKPLVVNLDEEIIERVRENAAKQNRSISNYIETILGDVKNK